MCWRSASNYTVRSKFSPVVEELLKFNIHYVIVLGLGIPPMGPSEGEILAIVNVCIAKQTLNIITKS